jgi:hypothetical protein
MSKTSRRLFLAAALALSTSGEFASAAMQLEVNTFTGATRLVNSPLFSSGPISFDGYQIQSAVGALSVAGWNSLHDQGFSQWAEFGAANPMVLGELQLDGSTQLALGQSLSLGNVFNTSVGIPDLEFKYTDVGGGVTAGPIQYVGFPSFGLVGDYNNDGLISHADYSVLGDFYGQNASIPNRGFGLTGPIGQADFDVYVAHYGQVAAAVAASGTAPSASLPLSITSSTTAEGNTQWEVDFSGVDTSLAGHLNFASDHAQFLSISGGDAFLDDGIAPVGVPGRNFLGSVDQGVAANGVRAFAALGSTLGVPSPGSTRRFATLVTEGTTPTALTVQGEYGYLGLGHSVNMRVTSGPGTSADDPVLPDASSPGEFVFNDVPSGTWVDPPLVDHFEYVMDSGSLFTAILDFPTGFADVFAVTAEGLPLGTFGPGDAINFVSLLGHGVDRFTVSNITPLVDADDATAFPLKLEFSTPVASFRMLTVPEPASVAFAAVSFAVAPSMRRRLTRL